MPVVIGTDEAGYGPNLGPLLISATAWRVPEHAEDLYDLLREAVCGDRQGDERIAIADSKHLYKPGGGLQRLEQGLLPALMQLGSLPEDWQGVWGQLAPHDESRFAAMPWHHNYQSRVPRSAEMDDLQQRSDRLQRALQAAGVQLLAVQSRAVFPDEFNDLVARHGSKGELLSTATLELIDRQLELAGDEPILIQCDKHGGRNRYSPLLQRQFPEFLVEIHGEGRAESVYRWGPENRRVEIRFTAKGERFLPAALASMACKYLRELAMESFNEYWAGRVENLRPTAGYPVDAKRFRAEIQAAQLELGISDHVLWRCR